MRTIKVYYLFLFITATLSAQSNFYNVEDFGAVGDGVTLETNAIQRAINACSANGGTVYLPSGKYLTGSLQLKSNVDIYISAGAVILGSTNIDDYKEFIPEMKSYNDAFLKHSIFYAEREENISIRGEGTIDGQGSAFKVTTKEKPARYKNRPYVIRFVECKNVRIENITMQNSAMWMQQYLACEDLFIHRIRVYNHANQNNDMMDIDGCKNVIISDCIGDTDDDGITLKSTSFAVTENVVITNCVISSHCNAIKLGTESHGGFRNISISNIVVKPSNDTEPIYGHPKGISGITLGMVDGGILEGVTISNIRIEGTHVPIYMRLGNRARKFYDEQPQPGVGTFNNVMISNVIATDVQSSIGCSITGIPNHNVQNVSLNNISIEFPGGGSIEDAKKILPELEDHYPESTKWGNLPAFGFFIRHADNVSLNNIEIRLKNSDARPALVCDDVKFLTIVGLKTDAASQSKNVISFRNVIEGTIESSTLRSNSNTFLEITGNQNKNISVINNVLLNVKKVIDNKSKTKVRESGNIR
ncbi:MAG: glycosyl hydrolase family 28 protein [Melioribacteraceae bacterium]|nr:glycosyl hydrolase family 28 protein [Melioribacteraceae bacterium]